jgi:hypothetical protein
MKQLPLLLSLVGLLLSQISVLPAFGQSNDYALMSATPYNSEILRARERLEKFLAKADAKKRAVLAQYPVVAIEAALLKAGEVGPILRRLNSGHDSGYVQDFTQRGETEVKFLLLFDSRNGQLVTDDGVLVVNTPQRGHAGMFGGISALYIGSGW